ncbi:MAG: hypothetical protein ACO3A4_12975 [Silvanigrellaceae bacterium]
MYNPLASYEENLRNGPSSVWNRDGLFPVVRFEQAPQFGVFDVPLHLPLGMPAGPLLSSAYVDVALEAGFCMPVYKTVRSCSWQSHPWPNVLRIQNLLSNEDSAACPERLVGCDFQLRNANPGENFRSTVEVVPLRAEDLLDSELRSRLSITNAFGVPSLSPKEWGQDFSRLLPGAFSQGKMTVLSFQGSRLENRPWSDFLLDTSTTARLAAQCVRAAGGSLLEMNVSCPNEAGAPIFTDLKALTETVRAASEALTDFPEMRLVIKLGVVPEKNILSTVEVIAKYAHGISAINTVSANIVTPAGERALGSGSAHGGVCGAAIRDEAIQMIGKLSRCRRSLGLDSRSFALVGVGGCTTVDDFEAFLKAGADVVHVATAAMWNLQFASECAQRLGIKFSSRENRNDQQQKS